MSAPVVEDGKAREENEIDQAANARIIKALMAKVEQLQSQNAELQNVIQEDGEMIADMAKEQDTLAQPSPEWRQAEEVEKLQGELAEAKALLRHANFHALEIAAEAQKGFDALKDIEEAWEAIGTAGNRGRFTLAEQITVLLQERQVEQVERIAALQEPMT